jgi:hypothetical protein
MVEPSEYAEVIEGINALKYSLDNISPICTQANYKYRYTPDKVKRLNKLLSLLTLTKDAVDKDLEIIDDTFNSIDSKIIVFLQNLKRLKDELMKIADDEKEELMKTIDDDPLTVKEEDEKNKECDNSDCSECLKEDETDEMGELAKDIINMNGC